MMIEADTSWKSSPTGRRSAGANRRGEFKVQLDHRHLGPTVNRLVVGLIASALFLGSSLLLAMKVPPLIFEAPTYFGIHQISILGTLGTMFSVMMMLRLYLAINASGHLSRDSEK